MEFLGCDVIFATFHKVGSIRCPVYSWDSTIQAYFCLWNLVGCSKCRCSCLHARMAGVFLFARHGSCHLHFQLFPTHFWSLDFRCLPDQQITFRSFLRAFSNFGASFAQLLSFSPLRCSAEIGPYFCHSWSRLVVVWNTCQSLPGPLWSFDRFLFQQSNFCETSPWIWETSLRNSKNHRCVFAWMRSRFL